MASNADINLGVDKPFSMEKLVTWFRRLFSPRKEVRGETDNGPADIQQVEGTEPGNQDFDQFFAEDGGLAFNQTTGTEKSANGRKIVFFDKLQEFEGNNQSVWFLATVTERVTKRNTAKKQAFRINYHNVKIEAILQKSDQGNGCLQAQQDG